MFRVVNEFNLGTLAGGLVLVGLIFSVIYIMPKCKQGEECVHPGMPGGTVFDVLEVLNAGRCGGVAAAFLGMPPVLGQLIVGFALKNVIPDQLGGVSASLNSMFRSVALAGIMLRAGLRLDFEKLRKSSVSTMVLATGPCIGKASTIAVLSIFSGMSWPFAFMLGVKLFLQFGIGGGVGWIMGKFIRLAWALTDSHNCRFALLFLVAFLTLFGFELVGMPGGGTLAVIMMGTTIHNSLSKTEELELVDKPVSDILDLAWSKCGAVLLPTWLGASLDASKFSPELVGYRVLLVALDLVGRSITLFFTLRLFPQWGVTEKLFLMVSWCPKATVQAALRRHLTSP